MEISTHTATQSFSSTTMQLAMQTEQDVSAQSQQVGYGRAVDSYNAPHHGQHGHHGHHFHHQQRAMGVFKQELNAMFSASFGAQFISANNPYSAGGEEQSSGELSSSTLHTAQRIVAQAPTQGSESLVQIRQKVETAAVVARQTVGNDSDIAEVENSVAKLNVGLDKLDAESASVVTSTTSVLHINSLKSEQSAIRIKTQEGDLVSLNLSQITHTSGSDFAVLNENGSSSITSVRVSEHSNYMLSIEGDINDEELEAIQNVFAQAELIADEFFDGDIAAAFEMASDIAYDEEQLAQVNLNFRSVETSSSYYSEFTQTKMIPATNETGPATIANEEAEPAAVVAKPSTEEPAKAVAVEAEPDVGADKVVVDNEDVVSAVQAPVEKESDPMGSFFNMLSGFLHSSSVSFQSTSNGSSDSFSFYHSQSFKLDILKVVIEMKSPAETPLAAQNAGKLIDAVKDEEVKV